MIFGEGFSQAVAKGSQIDLPTNLVVRFDHL